MLESSESIPEDTRRSNMKDIAITKIADEGDVILVVGEGKHGVQVSSQVLSCASKPFNAMFSRRFKEGSELASRTSPLVIPMPDDAYEPMKVLCNLLHHRVDEVPKIDETSIKLVTGMAKLCDKYACMKALSLAFTVWLKELVPHAGKPQCGQVIVIAYLLDDHTAFSDACREYMMCHTVSELEDDRQLVDPDGHLPERVWGIMETRIHAAYEVLQKTIQEEMQRLCEGVQDYQFSNPHGHTGLRCPPRKPNETGRSKPWYYCGTHDAIQLSGYVRFLNQHGLWPLKICQARVLRDICSVMSYPVTRPSASAAEMVDIDRGCRACITPLVAVLSGISEKTLKELDGVCLQCVRAGGAHMGHM